MQTSNKRGKIENKSQFGFIYEDNSLISVVLRLQNDDEYRNSSEGVSVLWILEALASQISQLE